MTFSNSNEFTSRALSVLRIVSAYLLVQHGSAKLLGFPHVAFFDGLQIFSMLGTAGVLELVGGALLLIGLFTRPVAFVLSGLLAFAYFIGHASRALCFRPCSIRVRQPRCSALSFCSSRWQVPASGAWTPCAWRRSLPEAGLCKGPPVSLEFDLESDEACIRG